MHGKPYSHKEFFVEKWATYVINNDDWSSLQAKFLNAQIRNARQVGLTKEQVAQMHNT